MDLSLVLGALLAASPAWVHHDSWSTPEGLPQSSITGIAQGPGGLLYVTTFGGMARFDGRRFDPWSVASGQGWSSIRTTAIAVGPDGTRWLGLQDGGVIRLSIAGPGEQLPLLPSLAGASIQGVAVTEQATWVVASTTAARYDGTWTLLPDTQGSSSVVSDGEVVYIAGAYGLRRCTPGCEPVDIGDFGGIADLAMSNGRLWAAGASGLIEVEDGDVTVLQHDRADRVAVSDSGTIWFSQDARVRSFGTDVEVDFDSPVRTLFVDREESLWVGTGADGLSRLFVDDWRLLDFDGGMPFLEHDDGTVWVGKTCGSGSLGQLGPGPTTAPQPSGCVRALAKARDDKVWIGTERRLLLWSRSRPLVEVAAFEHHILAALSDESGVWVGTDGAGAFLVTHDAAGTTVESVDVGDDRVLAIVRGHDGDTWFGTHLGFSRRDADGEVSRWTRADGAPPGAIRTLLIEDDGTVLMGSYGGGVGILRGGKLLRLTAQHGLLDSAISAIIDDGHGALWLNGNRGLMRIRWVDLERWMQDPTRTIRVRRWATPEGNGGTQPAGIMRKDGTLLFPTISGIVALNPRDTFANLVVPQVVLLSADVDGTPLRLGETVQVSAGPGRVQIEFTAGTLRRPELASLEYRYLDKGLGPDDGWKALGDDRRAVWGSLEPGHHVIELRAANEDGLWSASVQLRFELNPAWFQRRSVWIGLAGLLGLLGFGFHRWRTQEVQRQNTALSTEIDQRQAVENALRISEAHYRRVFEGGSDALMVVGPDGEVEHANRAADEMAGETVAGLALAGLFDSESEEYAARRVLRDDAELWVSVAEFPFDDCRTLVRASDVTVRVEAERSRRLMSQRLAQAERMEAVGRLAGGIAHDFNNLLTAVGGAAELLSESEKIREDSYNEPLLNGLRSCVERGSKLTRQLLSFARRQHLAPEDLDAGALVSNLRDILRPSLRGDITLNLDLPEIPIGVHADAAQLEMALLNLVLNSQNAQTEGGKIDVGVRAVSESVATETWPDLPGGSPSGWVVLEVIDDGEGISPDDIRRVFEPFFTTRSDGTGLGLPSAQGFALQSGGGLFLRSAPGKGTRASIVLPQVSPPKTQPKPTVDRQRTGVGRIVVVDDNDIVRQMVIMMLRSAGYDTAEYSDASLLLDEFDAGFECDVLVTDVVMPKISGPTLAAQLLARRPGLRVMFISGYVRDQVEGELPGPLLTKPFQIHELLAMIEEVKTQPAAPCEPIARLGSGEASSRSRVSRV